MPKSAGSRLLACVLCLGAAFAAPGGGAGAATDAMPNADEAKAPSAFMTRVTGAGVSLTGFHCGGIGGSEADTADFADPEMPYTVGLELFQEAGETASLAAGGRQPAQDDGPPAEMSGPLSARLKRIMVEGEGLSLNDGGMEDVSLSEASMSVADLIDRCRP